MSELEKVAIAVHQAIARLRSEAVCGSHLAELLFSQSEAISKVATAAAIAAIDGARWQPIESAQPSLAPGRYEGLICAIRMGDGTKYFSDLYHSWKNPDGTWARWPHDFPPTHHRPLPAPPKEG